MWIEHCRKGNILGAVHICNCAKKRKKKDCRLKVLSPENTRKVAVNIGIIENSQILDNTPKTGPNWPKNSENGPTLPKSGPKWPQTPRNIPKQRPNRVKQAQNRPKIGPLRLKICQNRPKIGPIRLRIGPTRSKWPLKPHKQAKTGPKLPLGLW